MQIIQFVKLHYYYLFTPLICSFYVAITAYTWQKAGNHVQQVTTLS